MARKTKETRSIRPRLTANANAAGYAKRQSRKAEKLDNLSDVYEYQPGKVKRSKVTLELDRDEAFGYDREGGGGGGGGSDDGDGGEDNRRRELRARLVGETDGDEKLDSGDDEEIDSDGAFEETDEERFAGFNFTSSSKVRLNGPFVVCDLIFLHIYILGYRQQKEDYSKGKATHDQERSFRRC
jgi:U3 small nucleolar RNA-associated protein 14